MKRKSIPLLLKEYIQGQVILLPSYLGAQIPPRLLVRVVNAAIEKMDLLSSWLSIDEAGHSLRANAKGSDNHCKESEMPYDEQYEIAIDQGRTWNIEQVWAEYEASYNEL